jgi:hypothetical protein
MPKWLPSRTQLVTGIITGVASWAVLEYVVKPALRDSTITPVSERPTDLAQRNGRGAAESRAATWYNPLSWY